MLRYSTSSCPTRVATLAGVPTGAGQLERSGFILTTTLLLITTELESQVKLFYTHNIYTSIGSILIKAKCVSVYPLVWGLEISSSVGRKSCSSK